MTDTSYEKQKRSSEASHRAAVAATEASSGRLATRLRAALAAAGCPVKEPVIAGVSTHLYATKGGTVECVYVECSFKADSRYAMHPNYAFDQSKSVIYFYGGRQSVRFRARKAETDGFSDARIKEIAEAVGRQLDREIAAHSANVELGAKRLEVEAMVAGLGELPVRVEHSVKYKGRVDLTLKMTEDQFRAVAAKLPGFLKEVLS